MSSIEEMEDLLKDIFSGVKNCTVAIYNIANLDCNEIEDLCGAKHSRVFTISSVSRSDGRFNITMESLKL